jgi:diacylglycerol kinase family enzyme
MVNIGFDCSVVKEASKLKKSKLVPPGFSYILGVVVVLFKKFGTKMKLIFDDGEVIDQEFTLTAIANGKYCGGGFRSAPKALLNDGLLDVVAIDKISRLTFIRLVKSYKNGSYIENKKAMRIIKHRQVPHFKMEFDSPIPICIDGEIKGAKTIDFSVVKDAFNFIIPKGSEYKENRK